MRTKVTVFDDTNLRHHVGCYWTMRGCCCWCTGCAAIVNKHCSRQPMCRKLVLFWGFFNYILLLFPMISPLFPKVLNFSLTTAKIEILHSYKAAKKTPQKFSHRILRPGENTMPTNIKGAVVAWSVAATRRTISNGNKSNMFESVNPE